MVNQFVGRNLAPLAADEDVLVDREALEEIASPLARALLLAMERARRAEARNAETAGLRETMDAVAQSLAEIAERIAPARRGPRKAQTIN